MSPVYKRSYLSVATSVLFYVIHYRCLHFINTRYDKQKDNMKKKFIFIYSYDSCPDNEETAIWLLYGSSAYMLMSELL